MKTKPLEWRTLISNQSCAVDLKILSADRGRKNARSPSAVVLTLERLLARTFA